MSLDVLPAEGPIDGHLVAGVLDELVAEARDFLAAAEAEGTGVDLQRNRNARLAGSGRSERVLGAGVANVVDVRSGSFAARSVTVISVSGTPQ